MMGRAEWRTDSGWQRFDRVALMVSLLLAVALLIVWFTGTTGSDQPAEPGPLAAAPATDEPAGTSASPQAAAADPADAAEAPGTGAVQSASDTNEGGSRQEQQAGTEASAGSSNANGPVKSLASQDPARQATFERIPKYLEQPIATGTDEPGESNEPGSPVADSSNGDSGGNDASNQSQAGEAAEPAADRLPASVMTEASGPKVTPILELRSADGGLTIDGIVSSESLRAAILKAGLSAYGMRNLTNRLAVNAAVAPFEWSGDAADLIVLIGGPESETVLRIDGNTVTLAGEVPAIEDKEARALAAQQFFGTRARVDNRLRVIAPEKPVASGAEPGSEPIDVAGLGQQPGSQDGKESNEGDEGNGPARAEPLAPVVPATGSAGQADSDLAEGGPGQVDSVTLLPTGMPDRIARGDCPRVATSVLIPFGSASTDLTEAARAALDKLAPCLSRRNYVVGGHTDNRGSAANNRALSRERAQAVVDYLVDAGVPTRRLTTVGHGESRPIISNRSERGRARNRRVDFRLKR